MDNLNLLAKAEKLVLEKLDSETAKHSITVSKILTSNNCTENTIIAGLLHDIIEDANIPYDYLLKEFNKEIADLILEVTHEGKKDSKGYYFPRLHTKEAIMIKFADRLNNLNRINEWNKKRQEHYIKKSKFWNTEVK